ncbi:hypothetical protein BJ973_004181 [Actinoplanes tereljensis]|uniref:FTP domain-containing protein n=1 Tax=Paractinoplanes tereljensis TaxID=571912 RepID=A0A919TX58_9ACTN|nr:M36 family metallopeptidase [Actinoplanes tereljensis]GIF23572.1 hypothetical protein Ate02nite_63020 [Actinoplanes tereljensis]
MKTIHVRQLVAATAAAALLSALLPAAAQAAPDPQGIVAFDARTGAVRQIATLDGFLTAASSAAPEKVARDYLAAHRTVFGPGAAGLAGLRLRKDYLDIEGTHHLSFTQNVDGVEVVGSGVKVHIAQDGRIIAVDGSPQAGLPASIASFSAAGLPASVGDGQTRQVIYGTRLAWEVIDMDEGQLSVVDAADGTVLFGKSLTANDHAQTWENYPGAPAGGTQHTVRLPVTGPALTGNAAHVYSDVNDDDVAQESEEVRPSGRGSFDFPFVDFTAQVGAPCSAQRQCSWNPAVPNSWQVNRAQNATQLYYYLNTWHDHLNAAPIGFTRRAGNFEAVDGDAVVGQSMDGANTADGLPDADHDNNANMTTAPDGIAPRMQMYLFQRSASVLAGNSGDAADIVFHEYTHGLSERLVVDAAGNSALISAQARAMGEAWGDWYGLDYLVDKKFEQDDTVDGDVREGDYILAGRSVRSEPIDCPVASTEPVCAGTPAAGVGGYTYGDYGKIRSSGGPEIHADGEIWAQTLWDLRKTIGSWQARSLVTRAMELAPADPSYLDMRNAILLADRVVNHGHGQDRIWQVFAARGMGFHASTEGAADTAPTEDFTLPPTK